MSLGRWLSYIHDLGKCVLPSDPGVLALGQNFKDQRLICGSWRVQSFRAVKGTLVFKCGAGEGEVPRPVDVPAPCEVILLTEASNSKIAGRKLQLLNFNASGPSGDSDHRIILVGFVLTEVQAFIKLASRVIAFANTACI